MIGVAKWPIISSLEHLHTFSGLSAGAGRVVRVPEGGLNAFEP